MLGVGLLARIGLADLGVGYARASCADLEPRPCSAAALRDLAGVEAAAIYGSYAARLSGVPDPPPVDIELLVIGTPSVRGVYAAAREVAEALKLPVNPTVLARDEWEAETAFLHSVRANPLLNVVGDLDTRRV